MTATVTRARVQCDEAPLPAARSRDGQIIEKHIRTHGAARNFVIQGSNLAANVLPEIRDRAADLVRVASFVYAADRELSRGGEADVYQRDWRRHITLYIQVADPDFWSQPELGDYLTDVLHSVTEDEWEFVFTRGGDSAAQIPLDLSPTQLLQNPDAVLLFSGGADSLCATVEAVAGGESRPVLVSHRPAPSHTGWQNELVDALRRRLTGWAFPHLGFKIHRVGGDAPEPSQRSRPFLFASLGAAVAGQLGLGRVLLADNGIISLGLPINGSVEGAQTSRSTHPEFIRRFNRFIAEFFAIAIKVHNPLRKRTREQVLYVLKSHGCPELLTLTRSCSRVRGRQGAKRHCGCCSQCVDRRFGTIAADLEEYDPADGYGIDIFKDPLPDHHARMIAESYVRFARRLPDATDDDLLVDYPHLFSGLPDEEPAASETVEWITALLKQHGHTTVRVLRQMFRRYEEALGYGNLPDQCLLRLALGSSPPPTTYAEDANVCRLQGEVWTLSFRGASIQLANTKGVQCLAVLLRHPGREFTCRELEVAAEGGTPAPNGTLPAISGEQAGAEGLAEAGQRSSETRLDAAAELNYRNRQQALKVERAAAVAAADSERVAKIDRETAALRRQLSGNRGLHGKLRPVGDANEQARQRVSSALHSVLDRIMDLHAELGHHLNNAVSIGSLCRYAPEDFVCWLA